MRLLITHALCRSLVVIPYLPVSLLFGSLYVWGMDATFFYLVHMYLSICIVRDWKEPRASFTAYYVGLFANDVQLLNVCSLIAISKGTMLLPCCFMNYVVTPSLPAHTPRAPLPFVCSLPCRKLGCQVSGATPEPRPDCYYHRIDSFGIKTTCWQ